MTDLGTFVGRFHPLVVHLPIGILIVAGVLELLARTRRFAAVRPAVGPTLWLGAIGAVVAASTGWLLGEGSGYAGDTYAWHQRMGIGVAVGAVLTAVAYTGPKGPAPQGWGPAPHGWAPATTTRDTPISGAEPASTTGVEPASTTGVEPASTTGVEPGLQPRRSHAALRLAYPILLTLTLAQVAIAGHLGGILTHGEGYLVEYAPAFLGFGASTAEAGPRVASRTIVYEELVDPVLQARCASCHGGNSAQGGLRLDSPDGLRKGGDSGPAVVAGRPDGSELIRRIWLPPSHEEAMPPKGGRPVTVAEAALLRWWIAEGASFDATLADIDVPREVQPAIEAVLGPVDLSAPAILAVQVPPPDPQVVQQLQAAGVAIAPLADDTSFLSVQTTTVAGSFGDAELESLAPLAAQVTWLSLSGTQVTDAGLSTLAAFTNLTRLHLDGTQITDAGLSHLAQLQRLEYLNLYGTRVSDDGLQPLGELQALRSLYLWKTAATAAGIERLRAQRPGLQVEAGLRAELQFRADREEPRPAQ